MLTVDRTRSAPLNSRFISGAERCSQSNETVGLLGVRQKWSLQKRVIARRQRNGAEEGSFFCRVAFVFSFGRLDFAWPFVEPRMVAGQ